jgi:hypothetical protein
MEILSESHNRKYAMGPTIGYHWKWIGILPVSSVGHSVTRIPIGLRPMVGSYRVRYWIHGPGTLILLYFIDLHTIPSHGIKLSCKKSIALDGIAPFYSQSFSTFFILFLIPSDKV